MEFQWRNQPEEFLQDGNRIVVTAGKGTNLFNSPGKHFKINNFPFYYINKIGDFVIRCKITPDFKALYDLGCIVVYDHEDKWIKFAYENSDAGHPAMVSVVTNETSDDCNGEKVEGYAWMQIIRKGDEFALHYSKDKEHWSLVRIFRLEMSSEIKLGISAQCPLGENCNVLFEGLEILENAFQNIRKPE